MSQAIVCPHAKCCPNRIRRPRPVGAVGWVRENLFSNWFNSILTVLALALILYVLSAILPWVLSPTWDATSLSECRDILAAGIGDEAGHGGACWGVIRERWTQLMFGFYPTELYWRPILAFVLLVVALAPILFSDKVPARLLYFSAVYPFIFPWLLWGGTDLGAAVGARPVLSSAILCSASSLAWPAICWRADPGGRRGAVCGGWFCRAMSSLRLDGILPIGIEPVESRQFGGFMLSITIGVVAIACSLPLGIVLALGRQSDLLIVKSLCGRLHRVHPRRAADHPAVRRLDAAEHLHAAGHQLRHHPAGADHGDAVRLGLYGRGDPRRSGGPAEGPVRGRRRRSG